MSKLKNVLLYLVGMFGLVFNSYGQEGTSLAEVEKAKMEVAAIDSVFSLTAKQKEELSSVMLEKNDFMSNPEMSVTRRNWTIEYNYLQRINEILQNKDAAGEVKMQARSLRQTALKKTSENKPVLDEKLLKRLNLLKVEEPAQ